jgi:hypothetical protein
MEKFEIEIERLHRVGEVLGRGKGDIEDFMSPDLKHLCKLLAYVTVLQEHAPGFMDELFALFIPHFTEESNKAALGEMAQKRANEEGFGAEWAEAIAAGKTPNKKNYSNRDSKCS